VHFQEDLGHTGIFQNDAALGFSYKSEMIVWFVDFYLAKIAEDNLIVYIKKYEINRDNLNKTKWEIRIGYQNSQFNWGYEDKSELKHQTEEC
jgi:hypothetical protein